MEPQRSQRNTLCTQKDFFERDNHKNPEEGFEILVVGKLLREKSLFAFFLDS